MTPPTPRAPFGPAHIGFVCALVAILAFATGGAGLAHRALSHAHTHAQATAQPNVQTDAHGHGGTACASAHVPLPADAPADAPADHDSAPHNCDVCKLLASGVTPPENPDAAPALWPLNLLPPATRGVTPPAAREPLPPARGPPSFSA